MFLSRISLGQYCQKKYCQKWGLEKKDTGGSQPYREGCLKRGISKTLRTIKLDGHISGKCHFIQICLNRLKKLLYSGKWQNYFTHKSVSTMYIPMGIYLIRNWISMIIISQKYPNHKGLCNGKMNKIYPRLLLWCLLLSYWESICYC